jgi:perosamine synthetase
MKTVKNGIFKKLEEEYADFSGYKYAVAVNSGTSALHLSLVALGIGAGDEVVVPDFSMAAAAFAVSYTGAKPVFVDCGDDLNIDVTKIEEKITKKTKAILPVHIYGRICDMKAINKLAKKYNLYVVEDACEVHGAKTGPATTTCFSFYKNKIVHAEEGGIICTNDKYLAFSLNQLKNMAFDEGHTYFHTRIGYNYRMSDAQATLALESLHKVKKNLIKRKKIESWYNKYIPEACQLPEREVVWVYDILHTNPRAVIESVPGARHFFKPMTSMPMYEKKGVSPWAYLYSAMGCYLPVNPEMTEEDVKNISKYVII